MFLACKKMPYICLLFVLAPRYHVAAQALSGNEPPAISVSSDFENGSGKLLYCNSASQSVCITPGGRPENGWPNWWHIRIDHLDTGRLLTLTVIAGNQLVFSDNAGSRKKLPPGWSLPLQASFSSDKVSWRHTAPGDITDSQAVYRIRPNAATIWVAWGPAFTYSDALAFVDAAARRSPAAHPFTLCRSRAGRPVPAIHIYEGDKPPAERPAVWIDARQHAWEAGGSWVGAGIIDWLLSDDRQAQWLRLNADLYFVPIMDVDHVFAGEGGKNALPQDHNLDWSSTPYWPEVAASQQHLLQLAAEQRMHLFLDLHNPGSGNNRQTAYVIATPYMKPPAEPVKLRFVDILKAQFPDLKQIVAAPPPDNPSLFHVVSVPWVLEHTNPHTIAFCIETPWNVPEGTIEGYGKVGEKLGKCIAGLLMN